jgi:hypothetical protein
LPLLQAETVTSSDNTTPVLRDGLIRFSADPPNPKTPVTGAAFDALRTRER